jgi:hypothetical protein
VTSWRKQSPFSDSVNSFCYRYLAEDPDKRLYVYREVYRKQYLVEDLAGG